MKLATPLFLDVLIAVVRLFLRFEDNKETNQGIGVEVFKDESIQKAAQFTILCKVKN